MNGWGTVQYFTIPSGDRYTLVILTNMLSDYYILFINFLALGYAHR